MSPALLKQIEPFRLPAWKFEKVKFGVDEARVMSIFLGAASAGTLPDIRTTESDFVPLYKLRILIAKVNNGPDTSQYKREFTRIALDTIARERTRKEHVLSHFRT